MASIASLAVSLSLKAQEFEAGLLKAQRRLGQFAQRAASMANLQGILSGVADALNRIPIIGGLLGAVPAALGGIVGTVRETLGEIVTFGMQARRLGLDVGVFQSAMLLAGKQGE